MRKSAPKMPTCRDVNYAARYGTGKLTPRLEAVAHCILRGHCAKEIMTALRISADTVKMFKYHLFRILGVQSAMELIVKERDGLVVVSGWRKLGKGRNTK